MQVKRRLSLLNLSAQEAYDVLHGIHVGSRQRTGTLSAALQDAIDISPIGLEPRHLGGDGAEFCDRQVDQRRFECRELAATEFTQHLLARTVRKSRIDADQIVR